MSWLPGGERYTRLPLDAVHDLLERWSPDGVYSMEADETNITITSAARCSESAEPCTPPCGLWWVEVQTVIPAGVGLPDKRTTNGRHMKDDDWVPVPVHGLPAAIKARSLGDHGYWL